MPTFTVEFLGQTPISDASMRAVGIRLWRDGEYFQFFQAAAADIEIVTLGRPSQPSSQTELERFWSAMAQQAVPLIERAVRTGEVPLKDSAVAAVVTPDTREAWRRVQNGEAPSFQEDDIIGEFIV